MIRNLVRFLLVVCLCVLTHSAIAKPMEHQEAINNFYLQNAGDPMWVSGQRLNKSGKVLLKALQQSWSHGLNPQHYYLGQIEAFLSNSALDDTEIMQLELLMTAAYIEYVRDLSGMRIRARDIGVKAKDWRQRMSAEDALSLLPEHIKNIESFLEKRAPQTQTYQKLKDELIALVKAQGDKSKSHEAISLSGLLRPNHGDSNVPKLRLRFGLDDVSPEQRYTYDDNLVQAVINFQAEKGLKPDGVIGQQTLNALNQSDEDKINQIIVNMERLRWIADEKPARFIVVNIPSATLWALDHGNVAFEMPVVVGRKKRETMSFITYIHGVRFNPTWTVPPTIKEEDILPQLQADPSYLADKGMELYSGDGEDSLTLDPTAVDWAGVSPQDLKGLRMVQVSGAHNPLGRIRVLMPNEYNIYLHDTNDKSLFNRADRARSSGCVRLQDPEKVAMFALAKRDGGWSDARMQDVLEKGKMRDIYTHEKMPVYLLYYTVWLGDNGKIIYGDDVYGYDPKIVSLLKNIDGFPILSNTDDNIIHSVD